MSIYTVHYIPKHATKHTVNENNENLQYFNKPVSVSIRCFCCWCCSHSNLYK